jgi:hypothetical protein
MADSFTGNINLRKPQVGGATDTWGGVAGLNADLDLLDAIFLYTGLSTVAPPAGHPLAGVPGVGLRIGKGMVLNVEGQVQVADSTDTTKRVTLDSSLVTTATTRNLQFPDENGVLATQVDILARVPTGTVFSGYYGTAPPGFVMADGRTIGDATSGAVNRANVDCLSLFTRLWTITANAQCPVLPGGRGASAAADWAAHKTIALPNHSGRGMSGRDDLSGTNQNILAPGMANSTVRGAVGGAATESAGVSVSGSLGVSTSVSVSVSVSGTLYGNITSGNSQAGGSSGGSNYAYLNDAVSVSGSLGGSGSGSGSGTASGSLSGATSAITNVSPTVVVDVIIAL